MEKQEDIERKTKDGKIIKQAKRKSSAIQTITELSFGTPEGTRTPSLQNRNLTLYPIALRARMM